MKTYKDVFVEELVVRQRPLMVALLKAGIVVLAIILTIAFYFLTGLLGQYGSALFPALFAVVCIAAFLGFRFLGLEYEYSFYSGDVDIDKIIGKRKRSNVMSFNCRNVELMAPYSEKYDKELESAEILDARGSGAGERDWIALIKSETGEKKVLAFSPSDRMLDAFRQYVRGGKLKEE